MASVEVTLPETFRPQRYPAIQPIVDAEQGDHGSLADKAVDLILGRIISGEFPAGTRLKTTELSEELGMSRTPVGKALVKLTSEGILAQPNNFQAVVTAQAKNWLVQTHELRQLLEPDAAARAAGNVPDAALDDLRVLARDVRSESGQLWEEAAKYFDFALHLTIAEYCGNVPMAVSIRRCWKYKALSYDLSEGCRSMLGDEYEQHVAILAAVANGDADKARQEMAQHLNAASTMRFSDHVV
ncbi:MAG: hypothetical protein CMJ58_22910 [Planctomycetaceae bacterium]|nr:hypothetical protein [Planctomycetaceae bacterium]